jgi:transposase
MRIICGVDVAKARLDVCIEPGGIFACFDNDAAGIAALAGFCREHRVDLVVMEAPAATSVRPLSCCGRSASPAR